MSGIRVQIREEYLKALPFGSIESRVPVALIWSYYGDTLEVSWLMQRLSHKTRAYFVNAGMLKGFL